jgi:hypothetical protein
VLIGFHNCLGEVTIRDNFGGDEYVNFLSDTTQHSFKDHAKAIMDQPAKDKNNN